MYVLYMCLSENACIPQQNCGGQRSSSGAIHLVLIRVTLCGTPLQTASLLPHRPRGILLSLHLPSHCQSSGLQAHTVFHVFQIPSQVLMLAWQALNSLGCLLSQKTVLYLQFLFFKTLALSTRRFGLFFLVDIKYLFIFIGIINFTNSIHDDVYQSNQGEQHFYFLCENFSYLNFKDTNDIICKHIS